jgi:hypothetical protein
MDTFLRAIDQQSLLIMIALRLKLNRLPEPPANLRCTRVAFDPQPCRGCAIPRLCRPFRKSYPIRRIVRNPLS